MYFPRKVHLSLAGRAGFPALVSPFAVAMLVLAQAALPRSWVLAQAPLGDPIALSNGSFEDIPRQAQAPRGWYDCGFSGESAVDVQPASVLQDDTPPFFNVTHAAFDGNTYLGMVVRDNETYEAVSQRLREPLEAGKCYTFSVYLARAEQYVSQSRLEDVPVNYDTPAKLRIWGGSSYCNRKEIIAESAPVKNEEWLQYNFRFEPKSSHAYILLEGYYKTPLLVPYNGNLLVDAAGKIVPVACQEDVPEQTPDSSLVADVPERSVTPPTASAKPSVRKPEAALTASAAATAPSSRPASTPTKAPAKLGNLSRQQLRTGSIVSIEKLYFKADSSAINAASLPVLDEVYAFLDANDDVVIEVGGHTNGQPPHEFCDALSTARAEAVVAYLAARGIDKQRLYAKGYGKRRPRATNRTATGRRRNQRVEIKVLSVGG